MSNLTAVSLFSGAGGMDVGFKKAGFSVIAANEMDAYACSTYRANHPETKLFEGDIQKYITDMNAFRGVDVVFGGPPCQGFSVAGKMDVNDPRSKLVYTFCDVISRVQPRAFVMENVKALGSLDKFENVRTELMSKFDRLGYHVITPILDARDFGIAQARERIFFIGIKRDSGLLDCLSFDKYKKKALSLRQTIAHLGPAGSSNNSRICNAKITLAEKPVLRKSPYAGMLFNGQGRPLNPDAWSSTLPASMGGNRTPIIDERHLYNYGEAWIEKYHKFLLQGGEAKKMGDVPTYLRRLTIDEAALIQCFPKNYIFTGSQSKIFCQIGNAVPCNLAYVVASVVSESLQRNNLKKGALLASVEDDMAYVC